MISTEDIMQQREEESGGKGVLKLYSLRPAKKKGSAYF